MSQEYSTHKFSDLHFCYQGRELVAVPDQISRQDKEILQTLGKQLAEKSSLPVQQERIRNWKKMNSLQPGKIMIGIDEVSWHEMNVKEELQIKSTDSFCARIEGFLRQQLYTWNHMQADMVIEPVIYSPLAISNSGVGLLKDAHVIKTDNQNDVVSHQYAIQIKDEKDIEKLIMPVIGHDKNLSEKTFQVYKNIFDGILPVEKRGAAGFWFAPWDDLVMWTGVQEVLLDLIMRPEYVHAIMQKMMQIAKHTLDEYEKLNLLSTNNINVRVGSGAYGYTDDLPGRDSQTGPVKSKNIWGNATPQIFSSVSPEQHKEFALDYENQWLSRFGLTYYGCCEPLHNKLDILKAVKNLRKISVSYWADLEYIARESKGEYVLSVKPTPSILAEKQWSPERAKADLEKIISTVRKYNCCAEIVMKDISTVNYEPQRLWEWAKIVSELTSK